MQNPANTKMRLKILCPDLAFLISLEFFPGFFLIKSNQSLTPPLKVSRIGNNVTLIKWYQFTCCEL